MKTKKIKFLGVVFTLLLGISFTSCLNSDNNESSWDIYAFVTVKNYMGSVYLLGDDGVTYYPTNPDVLKITSTGGATEYVERAAIYLKYVDNAAGSTTTTRTVTIVSGNNIPVKSLCDKPDTIKTTVPLQSLNYNWGANGYITVDFNFNYYSGTNFAFDLYPEAVQGDLLTLRLKQTYGKANGNSLQEYLVSYKIPYFQSLQNQLENMGLGVLTPVQDSIYVTILGTGPNNTDLTVNGSNSKKKFRISID